MTPPSELKSDPHIERACALDQELVEAARGIRVLEHLTWPAEAEDAFLAGWRAGRAELPDVRLEPVEVGATVDQLKDIAARCDAEHPLALVVRKNARSYAAAARMLGAIGTPDFTRWSVDLYGRPDDAYETQDWTGVDAAEFFLKTTDDLCGGDVLPESVATIPADQFAEMLTREVDAFFTEDKVAVVLDPDLASKAVAGSTRIRLRASAMFTNLDLGQLLQHEAYVHSATMLNGKKQPRFASLGLGAPRTTRAQEGIAVLAEMLTLSIDVSRLRRIALRIRALHLALGGADFIEVFEHFLAAGQSESESFKSAQRLFRGGDVRGGVAFTKDSVYLKGLLEVHAFVRIAVRDNRPELLNALFAGRLTIGDVVLLEPFFASGFLMPAHYVPPWARDLRTLGAALTYSAFMSRVDLTDVTLQHFVDYEA